ncbi:MAG TPA: iron hydrogenase small subunit [Spirochaetota bacterium]|nr:iron hydrogenase small subunit [Spirochaetota bacterium]
MKERRNITRRGFIGAAAVTAGMFSVTLAYAKKVFAYASLRQIRTDGVYAQDKKMPLRKSQDNPEVKQIYKDFLEHPNSHKAHELLHTEYVDRAARVKALRDKGLKLTY